jgi:drug/metabolite transporter (DMT)-like permease
VEVQHPLETLPGYRYECELFLHDAVEHNRSMRPVGSILCLTSAAAFGANGIFGKLAYDDGSTVGTLLTVRFVLAALLFWLLLVGLRGVSTLRTLARRDLLLCLALGAVGYSAQAGFYFLALRRMDASLLALIVYTYPVMVAVASIAVGREHASRRTAGVLALVAAGLVLLLEGPASGGLDLLGAALGFGAAVVYSAYILVSERVAQRVEPIAMSTIVCSGAAATLTVICLAADDLHPGAVSISGLGWLGTIALVSTVGAISLFFAGLRRVGPTAAAILSTAEPVVTVGLAVPVFGESLSAVQLAGAGLVLAAVLTVRVPIRPAGAQARATAPVPQST